MFQKFISTNEFEKSSETEGLTTSSIVSSRDSSLGEAFSEENMASINKDIDNDEPLPTESLTPDQANRKSFRRSSTVFNGGVSSLK